MNRRIFPARVLGLSAVVPTTVAVLSACGGGSNSGGSSGEESDRNCSTGAPTNYTNQSHFHSEITLSAAGIAAAVPGDHTLLGRVDHSHTVTLIAQDFVDLEAGMCDLSLVSNSTNAHTHTLKMRC